MFHSLLYSNIHSYGKLKLQRSIADVAEYTFWFRILSNPLYDGRILRIAAMEAMECGGSWIMKLQECLKSFGWCSVGAEEVRGLSSVEIKAMLET